MQFLKYAILFVSIILVLDLAVYFILDVRPASGPENNAVINIFTTASDLVGDAVNTLGQTASSIQEIISRGRNAGNSDKTAQSTTQASQTTQITAQTNITQTNPQQTGDLCLEKFNLTSGMIIFYHSNDIHSNAMIPIVSDLDGIYKFHDTSNLWGYEFNNCFNLSGTVPAFVCAGSKEKLEGEVSKTVLEDFCKRC